LRKSESTGSSGSVTTEWEPAASKPFSLDEDFKWLVSLSTRHVFILYRYNIPMRLWSIGFHRMAATVRCACANSPNALEILTDFLYYAYKFYTELLEEHNIQDFCGKWLEASGDLASYRMAVAIHEQSRASSSGGGGSRR